jgi:ABC-type Fe3+/spermidine/putrescine transport system ATPase subunit
MADERAQRFLEIRDLAKSFGGVVAVKNVSFGVEEGHTLALLGPSGCGKTTILRCLAGLERPDAGAISIAGKPVFDSRAGIDLAPEKRDLGIVFQSYAVWPHMTVADNVAFPLRVRGIAKPERLDRARKMLDIVGLSEFEDRSATLVSGGQQQRIALARALVHEPRLVLFDEALSNLDAQLREQMRLELKGLQDRLGFTAIYVTHDQTEAFGLAEQVVVMNRGAIETIGRAQEVFHRPGTPFVAQFLGLNVHRGRAERIAEGLVWVALGDRLVIAGRMPAAQALREGDPVFACVRREHMRLVAADSVAGHPASVVTASFLGLQEEYILDVAGVRFRAIQPAAGLAAGTPVRVELRPEDCLVFAETS